MLVFGSVTAVILFFLDMDLFGFGWYSNESKSPTLGPVLSKHPTM